MNCVCSWADTDWQEHKEGSKYGDGSAAHQQYKRQVERYAGCCSEICGWCHCK